MRQSTSAHKAINRESALEAAREAITRFREPGGGEPGDEGIGRLREEWADRHSEGIKNGVRLFLGESVPDSFERWAEYLGEQRSSTLRQKLGGPEHYLRLAGELPQRGHARMLLRLLRELDEQDAERLDRGESLYPLGPAPRYGQPPGVLARSYPAHVWRGDERDLWDAIEAVRSLELAGKPFTASDICHRIEQRRRRLYECKANGAVLHAVIRDAMIEQTRREDRIAACDNGSAAAGLAFERPWAERDNSDLLNAHYRGRSLARHS